MEQSQRASMRDGPLADLFRSTLGDEGERPVEPTVAGPVEPAAREPVEPAAREPAEPAAGEPVERAPQEEFREPPSEPEPPGERERNATSREAIEADLRSAEARLERVRDDHDELAR